MDFMAGKPRVILLLNHDIHQYFGYQYLKQHPRLFKNSTTWIKSPLSKLQIPLQQSEGVSCVIKSVISSIQVQRVEVLLSAINLSI